MADRLIGLSASIAALGLVVEFSAIHGFRDLCLGRLFLAGRLPGLLLLTLIALAVTAICWLRPGARTTMFEKARALGGAVPILGVILIFIGGIYGGLFSPVQAAAL